MAGAVLDNIIILIYNVNFLMNCIHRRNTSVNRPAQRCQKENRILAQDICQTARKNVWHELFIIIISS